MEQQIADVNGSQDNNRSITIRALRTKTRNTISALLNPIKHIPSENGLSRDWNGLAELCGISGEKIPNLKQDFDPSNKVLILWSDQDKIGSTIENLISNLEELDRFDIVDDIDSLIEEDVAVFKQNPNGLKNAPLILDGDEDILTVDDVSRRSEGLEPQIYDAFVLFADDDINFATEVIDTMEKDYNMKFCARERDIVVGGSVHDTVIKLISERCRRLLVIVSPAFLDSSANKFFYSFAQAIGIEQRQRKIIPILYKHCDNLPSALSCYFMLDYSRSGKLWNFWEKLYASVKTPEQKPVAARNVNLINRSMSQYNSSSSSQCLLKSVLHHENVSSATLKPINQVKFNSMVDLNSMENEKIIQNENMTDSNSANSLDTYSSGKHKNKSFYNRLKTMIKSKRTKNGEVEVEVPQGNDIEIEKSKKKKHFFSSKKKIALAS